MTYDDWKLATPPEYDAPDREPACSDCDDTGCPECRGSREDDTPDCNCGTCVAPDFTCIRED